ncbi:RNA polymerase sigma factor [Emergencia sp. 1XD21-10]|uniref:RNA polymerase sigma factor n=1 Tax=Emergencia sp. 1XD21-10 TaxID=2304569 RepID=UPI00137B6B65|nr:sigma-70 family RNA polymerase sigma factor [Emergencia sp. 1XD21-10]NCF00406.1 sigma-70 family RNA polymerase sigma factor [Emergencia sp. 1XD21-10]
MSEDARTKVIELIERKYKKLIQHIAREILRDSYLVEDAYQEVLLKFIAGHEDKFELPQDEIKNYLCAAVRNTALTMLYKNQKNVSVEQEDLESRLLSMDYLDIDAFHDQYGFGLEVQELLSKLDNKDKDILCLKYGEGYDNKEIGEMIDLSEEAVRKRLYRTRIRMQSILIEREGR